MKSLTEADVAWLESRIGKYRWTPEDCRRIIADLRAARGFARTTVGFCVNARETWPDWNEHMEVGQLFAMATKAAVWGESCS